jgi:uncharacterized lipoprotein YajG
MKRLMVVVLMLAASSAFGATTQQSPAPPEPATMQMMQNCVMNSSDTEITVADTPNGIALTLTTKSGNVDELRAKVREHVERMKKGTMSGMKKAEPKPGEDKGNHEDHHPK